MPSAQELTPNMPAHLPDAPQTRADRAGRKSTVPSERWVQSRVGMARHRRKGAVSDLSPRKVAAFFFAPDAARRTGPSGAPDA